MDFWNDKTTLVTKRKWKMWTQKIYQNNFKIKIKASSNEEFISEVNWKYSNRYFFNF
jgi:hypothetical protein